MCSICLTAPSFLHCFIKLFLYQQILWHLFPCQVIFAPTAGSNYGSFSMNFHSIRNVEVRFFLYVYIQRYFIYVFIYSFLCILYLLLPSVKHFVSKNIAKEEFRLYLLRYWTQKVLIRVCFLSPLSIDKIISRWVSNSMTLEKWCDQHVTSMGLVYCSDQQCRNRHACDINCDK